MDHDYYRKRHRNITGYEQQMASQITNVFMATPGIGDHRTTHPWLTGSLGDPKSDIWLLAKNPNATQADRIRSANATPQSQWAASQGNRLLRDALVDHGLKTDEPMASGAGSVTSLRLQSIYRDHQRHSIPHVPLA